MRTKTKLGYGVGQVFGKRAVGAGGVRGRRELAGVNLDILERVGEAKKDRIGVLAVRAFLDHGDDFGFGRGAEDVDVRHVQTLTQNFFHVNNNLPIARRKFPVKLGS